MISPGTPISMSRILEQHKNLNCFFEINPELEKELLPMIRIIPPGRVLARILKMPIQNNNYKISAHRDSGTLYKLHSIALCVKRAINTTALS